MINFNIKDDVAYIELNDGKANVFTNELIEQFHSALDQAETDAKVVLITGSGGKFSAGFDLNVINKGGRDQWMLALAGFELLLRLYQHPQPVLSAVNGHAFGMGAFTLLVSDTRIGTDEGYKVCLPETAGNMEFSIFLVGILKAELNKMYMKSAALQSRAFDPTSSVNAGFLDLVVPESRFESTVENHINDLKNLPLKQYAHNKLQLRESELISLTKCLRELEQEML